MVSTETLRHDIDDHERRIDDTEDKLSETRKAVFGVEKTMATVVTRLTLIERLLYATILGILAEVGNNIWHNLKGFGP